METSWAEWLMRGSLATVLALVMAGTVGRRFPRYAVRAFWWLTIGVSGVGFFLVGRAAQRASTDDLAGATVAAVIAGACVLVALGLEGRWPLKPGLALVRDTALGAGLWVLDTWAGPLALGVIVLAFLTGGAGAILGATALVDSRSGMVSERAAVGSVVLTVASLGLSRVGATLAGRTRYVPPFPHPPPPAPAQARPKALSNATPIPTLPQPIPWQWQGGSRYRLYSQVGPPTPAAPWPPQAPPVGASYTPKPSGGSVSPTHSPLRGTWPLASTEVAIVRWGGQAWAFRVREIRFDSPGQTFHTMGGKPVHIPGPTEVRLDGYDPVRVDVDDLDRYLRGGHVATARPAPAPAPAPPTQPAPDPVPTRQVRIPQGATVTYALIADLAEDDHLARNLLWLSWPLIRPHFPADREGFLASRSRLALRLVHDYGLTPAAAAWALSTWEASYV